MTPNHSVSQSPDLPDWLNRVRPLDVLRVIAAWDQLQCDTPVGRTTTDWLTSITGIRAAYLHHLRLTRNACAHPRLGPCTQRDLDLALTTARRALTHTAGYR